MIFGKKSLAALMLGAFSLTAFHDVNAYGYMEDDIINGCNSMGYDLLSAYQADSCTACHGDNQAKSAYSTGNYEYFCPAPVATTCTDSDGDGYYAEGESCGTEADFNDNNVAAYPGAPEDCTDGIDNDGNGMVDAADPGAVDCPVACTDSDLDGYAVEGGSCGAIDCNDNNPAINPGADEICSDEIDNNCNGLVDTADSNAVDCPLECTDGDADGYSVEGGACGAVDCDDTNADVNPGALEVCDDGVDNNCNGLSDSADGVCQNSDGGDDECEMPWWRSKGKRDHHHLKLCRDDDANDDDSSDDYDEEDEKDDEDERDDEDEQDDEDEHDDEEREQKDCDDEDRKSRKSRS
ncbi:MAG: putative metal-binding motif-containing protein [Candidatus Thiodiazotropha sp.]|nr:putative metal-binding motif-containing protein [Candidatus Thiodiazotropha taylori]PUB72378.1 MAG: hypothetical protein DBP03_17130 [gamma proteobacterium symbiont of Ctena orbiculata]